MNIARLVAIAVATLVLSFATPANPKNSEPDFRLAKQPVPVRQPILNVDAPTSVTQNKMWR